MIFVTFSYVLEQNNSRKGSTKRSKTTMFHVFVKTLSAPVNTPYGNKTDRRTYKARYARSGRKIA